MVRGSESDVNIRGFVPCPRSPVVPFERHSIRTGPLQTGVAHPVAQHGSSWAGLSPWLTFILLHYLHIGPHSPLGPYALTLTMNKSPLDSQKEREPRQSGRGSPFVGNSGGVLGQGGGASCESSSSAHSLPCWRFVHSIAASCGSSSSTHSLPCRRFLCLWFCFGAAATATCCAFLEAVVSASDPVHSTSPHGRQGFPMLEYGWTMFKYFSIFHCSVFS